MKRITILLDDEERYHKEERINTFLRSFFSARYEKDKLLLDNLDYIFYLICTFYDITHDFIKNYPYPEFDWNKVTELGFLEKLSLINSYYKDKKAPYNTDDVINSGIFNITFMDKDDALEVGSDCLERGYDGFACENHETLEVFDNNLLTDTITWVHELSHHFNINHLNPDIVRAIFTESLAFAEEFVYLDYLEEQGFTYEGFNYKYREFENLYRASKYCYMTIKPYMIFHRYGYFSHDNYLDFFEYDDDYDKCLDNMIEIIDDKDKHNLIYKHLKYSIAFGLSIYMYVEYSKDKSFYQKMLEFNNAIQEKDVNDCLRVIGITGTDDDNINKIRDNMQLLMEELINGSDYTIAKGALAEDYIIELMKLFDEKTVLYQNIDKLLYLINFLKENVGDYIGNIDVTPNLNRLSKASEDEKDKLIEDFYQYIGSNISLKEMKLVAETTEPEIKDQEDEELLLVRASLSGTSYYDEDKHEKHAIVHDTGLVLDSVAWVHEFKHLDNQPNKIRNEVSFLLTESISFTEELIYDDYLKELGYSYESALSKYDFLSNLSVYFEDADPIIKLFKLFLEKGRINKLDYYELFNDDNIEDLLSEALPLLTDDPDDILKSIRYTVACALSIYMYNEYKKDKSFMEIINELNKSINEKSLEECLSIIGITNLDLANLNKIKIAIDNYKNELNTIISSGMLDLYDIAKGKVIVKK